MMVISVSEAKQNLEKVIKRVMDDAEPAVLRTETGDEVVLLSRDEFNSWSETVYLLSSPANAAIFASRWRKPKPGKLKKKSLSRHEDYLHRICLARLPVVIREQSATT